MNTQEQLVLIDGSGYLFRAFYAMPALSNGQGMPTGAIYGVVNMLRRLEKRYPNAQRVVVFDPKGQTQRHEWYPDYKANRGVMPEDLSLQIPYVHSLVKALGWPLVICPGIEADDVIGTLAAQAKDRGISVCICSADKDFAQLVCDDVVIFDGMKDKFYDREAVYEKFHVWPEQIIDYLALVGDAVDHIPGVEKVGPKTAAKWLAQYQDLTTIKQQHAQIKGKVGERLAQALPNLDLYQKLVTIQTHLTLPVVLSDLTHRPHDQAFLAKYYQELGFKTWLKDLGDVVSPEAPVLPEAKVLSDLELFKIWCDGLLTDAQPLALSVCFDSQDHGDSVLGLCMGTRHDLYYVPCLVHEDCKHPIKLDQFVSAIKGLLVQPNRKWIVNHGKWFLKTIKLSGCVLAGPLIDVGVMSYIHKGPGRLSIDQMAYDYLGKLMPTRAEVLGSGAKQKPSQDLSVQVMSNWLTQQQQALIGLDDWFSLNWKDQPENQSLYDRIDAPLIWVLADMELRGVKLDTRILFEQSKEMGKMIAELEQKAHELSGEAFNLSSPKQLQHVLFEQMGLPILEKTPTGQPSTGESVLAQLAMNHDIAQVILRYRTLSKLKSTYIDALPKVVNAHTGRVHADFQQTVTSTGRLSCQSPNLQNIPIRTDEGRAIRHAFVATPGYKLLSLDYSQIELRIMAHISEDQALLSSLNAEEDVHAYTAAQLNGVDVSQVTSEQRRMAKVINFGIIYGMSAFGLAKQLGISRELSSSMIERYFQQYPGVKSYMEQTRSAAIADAYVTTLLGRKVFLPDINHGQQSVRRAQERAAINAPMQGTAAEIIKMAMLAVDKVIKNHAKPKDAYLVLQVHDELVFEIKETELSRLQPLIEEAMMSVMVLKVPLLLSSGSGNHWDEIH
ncbi:MAG: DNA polymerase I [Pseudomonadota bacterium]|nr:DNA polymerase I [Pseudomonadota bacterium]